jgi:hypothetical protein
MGAIWVRSQKDCARDKEEKLNPTGNCITIIQPAANSFNYRDIQVRFYKICVS